MLDDLLDEVKAAAKAEALSDYENEIDRLRKVVDSMERQIATLNVDRERWEKAYRGTLAIYNDLEEAIHALTECNER